MNGMNVFAYTTQLYLRSKYIFMRCFNYLWVVLFVAVCACGQKASAPGEQPGNTATGTTPNTGEAEAKQLRFACAISNGMKGDSLFFDISADRKKLSNLTFKGYWRCSGTLTQERAAGPKGSFDVVNNKVDGAIAEPPGGGATSWRFELHTTLDGNKATGTFRMNINNLGCDSYVLKFEGTGR